MSALRLNFEDDISDNEIADETPIDLEDDLICAIDTGEEDVLNKSGMALSPCMVLSLVAPDESVAEGLKRKPGQKSKPRGGKRKSKAQSQPLAVAKTGKGKAGTTSKDHMQLHALDKIEFEGYLRHIWYESGKAKHIRSTKQRKPNQHK